MTKQFTCLLAFWVSANTFALDAVTQVAFDSNLLNSPDDKESLSGFVINAELGDTLTLFENRNTALDAFGSVGVYLPPTYLNLSTLRTDVGLTYFWQPSPGFRAPWYSLTTRIGAEAGQFEHQQMVDFGVSLTRSQRWTDKVLVNQIAQYQHLWAQESQISGGLFTASILVDWAVSQIDALYVQPTVGYGRFESTYEGAQSKNQNGDVSRAGHLPSEMMSPNPSTKDYFLNEAVSNAIGEEWFSYGIEGVFLSNVIGFNKRLAQNTSLDFAYRYSLVLGDPSSYSRHQFFTSFLLAW